jgi:3(or 17)beta-hydroxysteroid dehydrogenase
MDPKRTGEPAPRELAGRVALVSGAGSGIGRGAALRLAAEGARVVATDLSPPAAEACASEIRSAGGDAVARALDVTREADWEAAVASTLDSAGRLDVLVASAGISRATPLHETTLDEWHAVLRVNLDGVFLGLKHALPAMRRRSSGSIVIVSSASGIKATPGAAAYAASKAAARHLARTAAAECLAAKDGIRVNCVAPGAVRTPMWESMPFFRAQAAKLGGVEAAWQAMAAQSPLGRIATVEEIADAILYLASDRSRCVTGTEIVIDGGYTL